MMYKDIEVDGSLSESPLHVLAGKCVLDLDRNVVGTICDF